MRRARALALALTVVFGLTSCATAPPGRVVVSPARGQTAAELDRDQFECALWAQDQAGADTGASLRNGALIGLFGLGALGSALGAAIGAATGSAGSGAVAGAIVGGAVGAPVGGSFAFARDRGARERAWHACLEGRGYQIRG